LACGDTRPNILFFFTDDQRNDTLGCAGHPIVKTPTIDSLAKRGVRFSNMFVSDSICWVSRSTILTGLTARSFGDPRQPDKVKPEAVADLYPGLLRKAGYRTAHFGKFHAKMPKGFDRDEHFSQYVEVFRNPYFKKMPDGTKRHTTEIIADHGIEFLKSQPKGQPFAMNLWFNASHAEDRDKRPGIGHFPWPQAVDGMYDDVQMPTPRLADPQIFASQPEFLRTSLNRERFYWRWDTPEKYQVNMRAYFRMISGIDQAMARVLKTLEEEGLAENTIIVYSADNGYYMGDRGFAGKWSHYEQSLRVPLIIFDPRPSGHTQPGHVAKEYAMNLDLPATFLKWADVEVPTNYQGLDLSKLAQGKRPEKWREEMFFENITLRPKLSWEGIRNRRYKYARYFDQEQNNEFLHDMQSDPDELVNLASDPKFAKVLATMRQRTNQLVGKYGGPLATSRPERR
jgi:choline-sulfatase